MGNISLQKSLQKLGRDASSIPLFFYLFCFLKKASYEVKVSGMHLSIYFYSHQLGHTIKILQKCSGCWSRDRINFNFLEKDQGLVSPPNLYMIFQEKCFSYYILLAKQISLSDCI